MPETSVMKLLQRRAMASQPVSGWVFAALCCSCSVLLSSTGHYKPVAYDWQWARTVSGNTSCCLPGNRKINCCFAAPIVLHVFLVSGCLCDHSSYGLEPKLCRCKLWHKMTQVHAAKPTNQAGTQKNAWNSGGKICGSVVRSWEVLACDANSCSVCFPLREVQRVLLQHRQPQWAP